MTLLDEPTEELLESLAKLKKLKQLTIVLPNAYGQTDTLKRLVKKFTPDLQMTAVEEDDYRQAALLARYRRAKSKNRSQCQ